MIKIAFFDIDGTLLEFGKSNPSSKTVYALNQLQKNGILLCIATGRSYSVLPKFPGIDFDILLTFNGSYVTNKKEVIYKNVFDHQDADAIISNLKQMKRAIAISNLNRVLANGSDKDLLQYFKFGNVKLVIDENFDEICKGDIFQIMCSCRKEEYDQILNGTSHAKIAAWWDKAVDIIPKEGGKGIAVKEVLQYYHLQEKDAIAFGDGQNDIEMLQAVGTGIAMGNAIQKVKDKANAVCEPVQNDGIYQYCVDNKLIKPII